MHQQSWKKRFSLLAVTVFAACLPLSLSACNTTEGIGRDIEAAGDAIGDAAEDAN